MTISMLRWCDCASIIHRRYPLDQYLEISLDISDQKQPDHLPLMPFDSLARPERPEMVSDPQTGATSSLTLPVTSSLLAPLMRLGKRRLHSLPYSCKLCSLSYSCLQLLTTTPNGTRPCTTTILPTEPTSVINTYDLLQHLHHVLRRPQHSLRQSSNEAVSRSTVLRRPFPQHVTESCAL